MSKQPTFHPVHSVYEGVFNTVSGQVVDLHKPTPEMIHIEDIARALSKICRFGGHTRKFYSVAQHSVLVSNLLPPVLMLDGLLHDATEAYVGDVIKPLKVLISDVYDKIEERFACAIARKFGLIRSETIDKDWHISPDKAVREHIKQADRRALELEHEAFQKGNLKPLKRAINACGISRDFTVAWGPDLAEALFLQTFSIIKRK